MTLTGFDAPQPPEPAPLQVDTPCRKCQYNLRGLTPDSRCPECGTPVGFSTRGDLIRYSDPAWTDVLRNGINCTLWAVGVSIASIALACVTGPRNHALPVTVARIGASVLYLLGGWFLTTPDPSGLGEDRYGTSRKLIRITLLIAIVEHLLGLSVESNAFPPALFLAIAAIRGICSVFNVVGTFAMLRYISKLSMRIPDAGMATQADNLMWGVGIPLGILSIMGVFIALSAATTGVRSLRDLTMFFGCVGGICGLVLMITGIMYLLLLMKLGRQFGAQADLARQIWTANTNATV